MSGTARCCAIHRFHRVGSLGIWPSRSANGVVGRLKAGLTKLTDRALTDYIGRYLPSTPTDCSAQISKRPIARPTSELGSVVADVVRPRGLCQLAVGKIIR